MENPYEASILEEPQQGLRSTKPTVRAWILCIASIVVACTVIPGWFLVNGYVIGLPFTPSSIPGDVNIVFYEIAGVCIILAILLAAIAGVVAPVWWPRKIAVAVLTLLAIRVAFSAILGPLGYLEW